MRLFGEKKLEPGKPITMNIHENRFEIDGKTLDFPAKISEMKKVLGEPRIVDIELTEKIRVAYSEDYGVNPDSFHPKSYYWDEYGVVASAYDQENCADIVIFFGKSKFPLPTTKYAFSGTFLFDGRPWQEVVLSKEYNDGYRMKNSWVHASIYGNRMKEKNMKVMEWMLTADAKKEFKEKVKAMNLNRL
jgi:hypothetical protein